MSDIPESIRKQVRERAGHRCEYCLSHQAYVMGRLQLDHIQPMVKGGSDDEANLCLACELCNQHKWTKTEEIDPETKQYVPIFNPRQQMWSEHFRWNPDGVEIIGLTACGRASIVALNLNNVLALTVRRNWVKAGWHPPQ